MVGIFDSGLGGLAVLNEIRKQNKSIDLTLLSDYKNAPYGTKTPHKLLSLVKDDIEILEGCGAKKILIGCCTASTVYDRLSKKEKEISVPIIAPTAREAVRISENLSIGVIGTRLTISSHAFKDEILKLSYGARVYENEAQNLVSLVESGNTGTRESRRAIKEALAPLLKFEIDCLILGCTHFEWIRGEIESLIPKIKIVSSPVVGAMEIIREFENEKGCANTYFIGKERGYRNGKIQTWKNKRCGSKGAGDCPA